MAGTQQIITALNEVRGTVRDAHYPLTTPGAAAARTQASNLIAQLDDYLLPRLDRLDAPLLVVVGGSTGAGKSTLINSLVSAPVSPAGVLRPTTRAPVLISHPTDGTWFSGSNILPGLARVTGSAATQGLDDGIGMIAVPDLTPGLAFIDAPDIDSVVDANRASAAQLFAAADLWLFVTTAARYADAVPWDFLRGAKERNVSLALVLDRIPPGGHAEVVAHFKHLLDEQGLDPERLFIVPETQLDAQGLLPPEVVEPISQWFTRLAADAERRAALVRRTLDGALKVLPRQIGHLVEAADEQQTTLTRLDDTVNDAYDRAEKTVEDGISDGTLLRGEVLTRWQEFVGTGELSRALETGIGRLRDRITTAFTGRKPPGEPLREALTSGVAALITAAGAEAAETAEHALKDQPTLPPPPDPITVEQAERLVRDWQAGVLELVREEGASKRGVARVAAYTVNATGLLVMIAVFAATHFIPTGAEVGVAAGTTVVGQKVLEAIFGDQAVRNLAHKAREDLTLRVKELYDDRRSRFLTGVTIADPAPLRAAALKLEKARTTWEDAE